MTVQSLQITLETPKDSYAIYLLFSEIEFISATPVAPNKPVNASIKGSVGSFFSLLLSQNPRFAASHGLSFEGDPQTLLILEQWLSVLEFAQSIRQFCKDCLGNVLDYCIDDKRSIAATPLVDDFLNKVDQLRAGIDRLEARLQQWIQQQPPKVYT